MMRIGLIVLISCLLFPACFSEDEKSSSVITLDEAPEEIIAADASVRETTHEKQDAGMQPPVNDAGALGQQSNAVLDAGQEAYTQPLSTDAGMSTTENTDAGGNFGCTTAFFDALAPHLSDLVVIPSESDSFWYEFEEESTNTGPISLDELRAVFEQVGNATEGVIEEDWDDDLVWVIEYADDPQAAQATVDTVESVFADHLTEITYVHFGASEDVEQYFLRVGRSACGEILGLWTLVIWT